MWRLKVFSLLHKLPSAWEDTETGPETLLEGEHIVHSPVNRTSQVLQTPEVQSPFHAPETGVHLEEPVESCLGIHPWKPQQLDTDKELKG